MGTILARHRSAAAGHGNPPPVHAYRVPDDPTSVPVWRAVCGDELKPDEAEEVPRFTGAPCSVCMMFAIGHDGPDLDADARARVRTYPVLRPVSPTGRYAVALWGERESHFVAADAARGRLDGRDVVHALCGHLGWGPLDSPPSGWPVCRECQHISRT